MRVPIRITSFPTPSPDALYRVRFVRCRMYRNFWFTAKYQTAPDPHYKLAMYDTRAHALAQVLSLGSGNHYAGSGVEVPITINQNPIFNPGPTSVVVDAVGTWDVSPSPPTFGWVDDVEVQILRELRTILANYQATNEALDGVTVTTRSVIPTTGFPVIGLAVSTTEQVPEFSPETFHLRPGIDAYVWGSALDSLASHEAVASLAGTLRSILCDEQREVAGFALDGEASGALEMSTLEDKDAGQTLYQARLSLRYRVVEGWASVADAAQANSGIGQGGKYRTVT